MKCYIIISLFMGLSAMKAPIFLFKEVFGNGE